MGSSLRILIITAALVLSGCATYGTGMTGAIHDLQQGNYQGSEAAIKKSLKPTGNDRFLYHVELAVVKHLEGEFAASNALLEQAERIADDLETISLSDSLLAMMTNPRLSPYGGADFERIFVNYYKALNYFALAQQANDRNSRLDALEGARVEARRLIMRLNDINDRKGTFTEKKDEDEAAFASALNLFHKLLQGNLVDKAELQYRDDAMAHYLSGISFEMNGDYDDARISYQKAASAYEDGFVKQYRLDDAMISQAWFDTIRMMRISGGYDSEWRALADKKLSKEQQAELERWDRNSAQVVVLEHKGLAPQRREMNLNLTVNPEARSFQLRPYFVSSENKNELAWFYMHYADKGVAGVFGAYLDATSIGIPLYGITKTVFLGPLWKDAERLGLTAAIGNGMRITVPYYEPIQPLGPSTLSINGTTSLPMLKSANPALLAMYEQMLSASLDIQLSLTRAFMKGRAALELEKTGSYGALFALVGNLAAQLSDAAETRNWLLLPQDIRIQRLRLEPGEHQLRLQSELDGSVQTSEHSVTLNAGEIHFWRVRTLPALSHTPKSSIKTDNKDRKADTKAATKQVAKDCPPR